MRETAPIDHGLPGYGWTAKKVGCLCRQWYGSSIGTIGRTTLYRYLHQVRLSWKKCQKVLAKANPKRRADFVQEMEALYARLCTGAVRVLYLDESHIHRDLETGYTWATTSEKKTAIAAVHPNWTKNLPATPLMKAVGRKTAISEKVVAITANPISSAASMAA